MNTLWSPPTPETNIHGPAQAVCKDSRLDEASPTSTFLQAGAAASMPAGRAPRALLVGYNGANNTGAEARVVATIDDVRAVLGPEALITIPTLNVTNTRRYIAEGPRLHLAPLPTIYFTALRRLVREHDLILLAEGSVYMDTWTSFLLWYFLWATRCAGDMGKPCLAYAVDAGTLSPFNQRLVRREANRTDLIIVRNQAAAARLRRWGVTAPLEVTADTAFTFTPDAADEGLLQRIWPGAASGVIGLAVVDCYRWPVILRPWGRREDCYKWPYYFSHSPERRRASAALAAGYAALADRIIATHGKSIALICSEELDESLAREIRCRMANAERARIFSSRDYNASQMTMLLRSLDLLVTSRYHAGLLSLAAAVPQVAVGHDLRLKTLYRELGLGDEWCVDPRTPDLHAVLNDRVERLLANPAPMRDTLRHGYACQLARARRNQELLRAFVLAHNWGGSGNI